MESLFITLSQAVEGAPLVAISASLVWGVLSILLSPCHLSSLPLIVAFVNGQGQIAPRRAFVISSLFSVGILITVALLGVATFAAGRMLGDVGSVGNYLVAGIFFVTGLHLLGLLPEFWSTTGPVGIKQKGLLAAFLLGLLFGIALGPCTFAFMAPILGVTFGLAAADLSYGAVLLLAYGAGHCAVIVLAGTFSGLVQRYLDWNEGSRGGLILRKVCGVLVLAGGVYMIYIAP